MRTIALLTISNIFHDSCRVWPLEISQCALFKVILLSWMIAFFEYCFQVPANRIGSYEFTAAQLKTIPGVITLVFFSVFSVFYLKRPIRWNHIAGFGMIISAVGIIFRKWQRQSVNLGQRLSGVSCAFTAISAANRQIASAGNDALR